MKRSISIILAIMMLMSTFAGLNLTAFASVDNGWYKNDDGIWYYYEDGEYVTGWKQIKGKWYYFEYTGEMVANQHYHMPDAKGNDIVYVFDKNGAMMSNGWAKIVVTYTYGYGDDEYTETETEWYYLRKSGTAVTEQWKKLNGKWYYFDNCGEMACNETQWIGKNGEESWYDEEGAKLYAFDQNGAWIDTWGWAKFPYSYTDSETGKEVNATAWSYIRKDGTVYTGWLKFHNEWYYLEPYWGIMYFDGLFRIGGDSNILKDKIGVISDEEEDDVDYGKLYAFDKDGKMLSNQWYKGNEYGSYGPIAVDKLYDAEDVQYAKISPYEEEEYWYYLGADGAAVTGWKQIKGTWYYFVPNYGEAIMVTGPVLIGKEGIYSMDGTPYFFLDSGAMAKNRWVKVPDYFDEDAPTEWAYATNSGIMATGWKQIKGDWYYFGTKDDMEYYCIMRTGWLEKEDGTYYLGTDGKMVTGTVEIDGSEFTFDDNGRLQAEEHVEIVIDE